VCSANHGAMFINLAGAVFKENATTINRFPGFHWLFFQGLFYGVKLDGKQLVIHATQIAAFLAGEMLLVDHGKFFR